MIKMPVTMDDFLRALQGTNPFGKNRVSGAADFEADVPGIHGEEFKQLVRRVERVGCGGGSSGLLIVGGAGVGKSHLLGRLARWAEDKGAATVLFLHNIVASPERMPRYLLRASVSVLTGLRAEGYGTSELHRLLRRAIRARLDAKTRSKRAPAIDRATQALDSIAREVDDQGDIARALVAFYEFGRSGGGAEERDRARAAVQWLAGESIGAEAAESLELDGAVVDGASLRDDAEVELVFRVLAHLGATAGYPLVLCVDQVDNLDDSKVQALAQFLQVLLDHTGHMLMIVSGVKETMLRFRAEGVIGQAAWDRLAQHKLELTRIDEAGARLLIKARLEQFAGPFDELARVSAKRRADELFPLDEAWLKEQLELSDEFRPRDVITWASDRWEQQQERLQEMNGKEWLKTWPGEYRGLDPGALGNLDEVIDAAIAVKLVERVNERKLQPDALPPDADNLATLSASLLAHCRGRAAYSLVDVKRCVRGKRPPIYDLLVQERRPGGADVTSGVLFISSDNATRVTFALQRLVDDLSPPAHRILVTDDERRPLPLAAKGRQHLRTLEKQGAAFQRCALTFEGHAMLDALYGIIASARVGDLEVEYPRGRARRVGEDEAIESLHRLGKFAEHPLLAELLTEGSDQATRRATAEPIDEKRARETIAAHLSWRLCLTSREVAQTFIEVERLQQVEFEEIHGQIKEVAESLHREGHLHATAVNDALYLQLLRKGQSAPWASTTTP